MVRHLAATPLLGLGLLVLGGCMIDTERPLYAANPAYYDYYAPPVYYGPYYAPRSYSGFSLSLGNGRRHHHHHHRNRHRHWW